MVESDNGVGSEPDAITEVTVPLGALGIDLLEMSKERGRLVQELSDLKDEALRAEIRSQLSLILKR